MVFADITLARQLELNAALGIVDYAEVMARLKLQPNTAVLKVGSGYAIYTGPVSFINRAGNLGMAGPVSAADLELLENFYQQRHLPTQLELCPLADPDFVQLLGQRHYRVSRFINQHFRILSADDANLKPADEVVVERVGPEQIKAWVEVGARGFSGVEDAALRPDPLNLLFAHTASNLPNVQCFLAKIGPKAVGGGALRQRDNLADLFAGSVLPSYRGRGVQRALIEARLAAASAAGCEMAVTTTVPGNNSQRNLERHGFRIAYTRSILIRD